MYTLFSNYFSALIFSSISHAARYSNIKTLSQNVAGIKLTNYRKKAGALAPLRIAINAEKPTFITLSETRIADNQINLDYVFKGYKCLQNSSSGQNAKGVCVFYSKSVEIIPQSVYNDDRGFFTLAVYQIDVNFTVLCVGIYGPPDNSDNFSYSVYDSLIQKFNEIKTLYHCTNTIFSGDFNLHFDVHNKKPKTCFLMRNFFEIGRAHV